MRGNDAAKKNPWGAAKFAGFGWLMTGVSFTRPTLGVPGALRALARRRQYPNNVCVLFVLLLSESLPGSLNRAKSPAQYVYGPDDGAVTNSVGGGGAATATTNAKLSFSVRYVFSFGVFHSVSLLLARFSLSQY